MFKKAEKSVVGRVEKISLPELGVHSVHAKIDTGADLSSIWATNIHEKDGVLKFKLFGKGHKHYTGEIISVRKPDYLLTKVANSFGHSELRFVVKLQVRIAGKLVRATFSLSDRSKKTYSILIGRKLLNRKFLVDVSRGTPLIDLEKKAIEQTKKELEEFNKWEAKT